MQSDIPDDIEGWYRYSNEYQSVIDTLPGGRLVEVGAYLGKSGISLALKAKKSGKPFRVYLVETGLGSGVEQGVNYHQAAVDRGGGTFIGELHRNIVRYGVQDVVTLLVCPSFYAAHLFAHNSVDFCFLDASHDYNSVCEDLESWLPKIRPGGILGGDDYDSHWVEVVKAVQDNLPGHTPWGTNSWKYIKPSN